MQQSARQQIRLILLVAQFNDGALHGLDAGLLQQSIKVVKAALLGPEGNAHRGEITVTGLPNQTFTALGEVTGIHSGRNHEQVSHKTSALLATSSQLIAVKRYMHRIALLS